VYRYFNWLIKRNWFGKNRYGRYYFRGIDRVHAMENWTFGRAAIMYPKDLKTVKAFLAGAVFASLAETGKGLRTEQLISRTTHSSKPPAAPISLSVIADTLNVHHSTAYRLRKLANDKKYIKNETNLVQITNLKPNDIKHMEYDKMKVPVELLGYADKRLASIDRVRYKNNKLYLQEPNLVKPLLHLKSRKGLSKYQPY